MPRVVGYFEMPITASPNGSGSRMLAAISVLTRPLFFSYYERHTHDAMSFCTGTSAAMTELDGCAATLRCYVVAFVVRRQPAASVEAK